MQNKIESSLIKPMLLLGFLFILNTFAMWPGIMSADGMEQYRAAVTGEYSDHHPPMMSFVWHYLNMIHTGPGLMLIFHLIMIYTASAIFMQIFRSSKFKWWFAIFPIVPGVLVYTPLIVKDVSFAFSYLLAGAIIAYLMVGKLEKYKWSLLSVAMLLLLYGTAVKYQARFVLMFFTFGIAFCMYNYQHTWKVLVAGLIVYFLIIQAMFNFNNSLVKSAQQSHSWQLVKIYDLAAMSIALNKPMFPEFMTHDKDYSFENVKKYFNGWEVDPLSFTPNAPLKVGRNEDNRAALLACWQNAVKQHPFLYLKVRFGIWKYSINGTAAYRTNPAQFLATIPMFKPIVTIPELYSAIGSIYSVVKVLLQFTWLLPLLFIYLYLGIVKWGKSSSAAPLLMFSLTSFVLIGILYFMSMCGTGRYLFICVCLVHASHGFAYRCLRC